MIRHAIEVLRPVGPVHIRLRWTRLAGRAHQVLGRAVLLEELPALAPIEHDELAVIDVDLVGEGIIIAVLELDVDAADRARGHVLSRNVEAVNRGYRV
jgi:hypothetical protein